MEDRIWSVIVNPHAGSGKTLDRWNEAEKLFGKYNIPYRPVFAGEGKTVSEIASETAAGGCRHFIAVGGDGTVHDVLSGVMEVVRGGGCSLSDFFLAVIPIGSGNDWIRTHRIPHELEDVAKLIAQHSFKPQDVVEVSAWNGGEMKDEAAARSYMINVAGVAFDAQVCEKVNARKSAGESGKLLYVKALLHILMRSRFLGMRVSADGGELFSGKVFSIAFGVGKYSGGGMKQVPDAVIDDGLVDMTLIPDAAFPRIIPNAWRLFSDSFQTIPNLITGKFREVVVDTLEGADAALVEVDGEIIGKLPARVSVLPDPVMVLSNI